MVLQINCIYDKAPGRRAPAPANLFRVGTVRDESGSDLSHLLDRSTLYFSLDGVRLDLALALQVNTSTIQLTPL